MVLWHCLLKNTERRAHIKWLLCDTIPGGKSDFKIIEYSADFFFLLSCDLINAKFFGELSKVYYDGHCREMGKLMFGDDVVSKKLLLLICNY